ncbi:Uncharacterised protein [uncultured archaeon]|nr:Uncharacterised protein [uncultured archaeon]
MNSLNLKYKRKNVLNSTRIILDYIPELNKLILRRNGNEIGRKYSKRGAYNLAITLLKEMENGKYIGDFEISSEALLRLREYETDYQNIYNQNKPKPAFEISALKPLEKVLE